MKENLKAKVNISKMLFQNSKMLIQTVYIFDFLKQLPFYFSKHTKQMWFKFGRVGKKLGELTNGFGRVDQWHFEKNWASWPNLGELVIGRVDVCASWPKIGRVGFWASWKLGELTRTRLMSFCAIQFLAVTNGMYGNICWTIVELLIDVPK